jgi:hypothetical protein
MATAQEELLDRNRSRSGRDFKWCFWQKELNVRDFIQQNYQPSFKARRVVSAILARRVPLMPKQNLLILGLIFTLIIKRYCAG